MYVYIGNGHYFPGLPARDMTDAEWSELPQEDREQALKAGLYEYHDHDNPPAAPATGGE